MIHKSVDDGHDLCDEEMSDESHVNDDDVSWTIKENTIEKIPFSSDRSKLLDQNTN